MEELIGNDKIKKSLQSILKNKTNQYLIFGNDPIRFCVSSDNSARLVKLDDKTIGLEYSKH